MKLDINDSSRTMKYRLYQPIGGCSVNWLPKDQVERELRDGTTAVIAVQRDGMVDILGCIRVADLAQAVSSVPAPPLGTIEEQLTDAGRGPWPHWR